MRSLWPTPGFLTLTSLKTSVHAFIIVCLFISFSFLISLCYSVIYSLYYSNLIFLSTLSLILYANFSYSHIFYCIFPQIKTFDGSLMCNTWTLSFIFKAFQLLKFCPSYSLLIPVPTSPYWMFQLHCLCTISPKYILCIFCVLSAGLCFSSNYSPLTEFYSFRT